MEIKHADQFSQVQFVANLNPVHIFGKVCELELSLIEKGRGIQKTMLPGMKTLS